MWSRYTRKCRAGRRAGEEQTVEQVRRSDLLTCSTAVVFVGLGDARQAVAHEVANLRVEIGILLAGRSFCQCFCALGLVLERGEKAVPNP